MKWTLGCSHCTDAACDASESQFYNYSTLSNSFMSSINLTRFVDLMHSSTPIPVIIAVCFDFDCYVRAPPQSLLEPLIYLCHAPCDSVVTWPRVAFSSNSKSLLYHLHKHAGMNFLNRMKFRLSCPYVSGSASALLFYDPTTLRGLVT